MKISKPRPTQIMVQAAIHLSTLSRGFVKWLSHYFNNTEVLFAISTHSLISLLKT